MSSFRTLLFAASLVLTFASAVAQEQVLIHKYDKAGNTSVEVQSIFGTAARHGALPYRVIIRNNSGRDRVWTLRFSEGYPGRKLRTESTFRIEVENGKEVQHDIAFRFGPSFAAYDYRDLSITAKSPGLESFTRNKGQQTNGNFPFIAMSKPLAQRNLAALNDAVEKANSGDKFFAQSFEPSSLPTDWLGYTGLDFLLIDEKSWNGLRDAQRQGILSWVRLGGNLDLYTIEGNLFEELKLPAAIEFGKNNQTATHSLGEITIRKWNGTALQTSLVNRYRSHTTRSRELEANYESGWSLGNELEEKDFDPVLIFILLLAFAIIVAPLNLFVFAKSGRRHRLFITTPLISVVACVVIVAFIFLKDGLGGRGLRVVFADLHSGSGEMKLYTTQEQISRTGVMLSPGFKTATRLALNPVKLPDSAFNPLSQRSRRSTVYDFSGDNFSGGFFRSRSEQGFTVQSAEPTRARVETVETGSEDGPPKLVSNLAFPIREFFYVDEQNRYWKSPDETTIASGHFIPLTSSDRVEFESLLKDKIELFSRLEYKRILNLSTDSGRFFAIPADPSDLAITTHPSISWDDRAAILSGSVVDSTPSADE